MQMLSKMTKMPQLAIATVMIPVCVENVEVSFENSNFQKLSNFTKVDIVFLTDNRTDHQIGKADAGNGQRNEQQVGDNQHPLKELLAHPAWWWIVNRIGRFVLIRSIGNRQR